MLLKLDENLGSSHVEYFEMPAMTRIVFTTKACRDGQILPYGNESPMRGDSSSHSTSILQIFDAISPVPIREYFYSVQEIEVAVQFLQYCNEW